ncbi:MAG: LptF/LptG family permease [Puniceicoccales bacterium]|nr:LptF/LptG family permease [Puniceicoccales bacterium]
MVRLIQAYIFKEGFFHILLSVTVFVFILLSGNAIRDVLELAADGKVSLLRSLKFLCILTPSLISYALPLGILTGTLLTIGKLSSNNEILVLKSAGISLFQIASPLLLIAIGFTIFSLFINFEYAPKSIAAYRRSLKEMIREDPMKFIRPRTFVREFPGYILFADRNEQSLLRDFYIWELDWQGCVTVVAHAETAEISYDTEHDLLFLSLRHGTAEKRPHDTPENFTEQSIPMLFYERMDLQLPLGDLLARYGSSAQRLKYMTLYELLRARRLAIQQKNFPHQISIQLQIQRHCVMAFAILSMVLLGIPLAMKSHRSETFIHLTLAIALSMAFYFSVIALSWLEDSPRWRADILIWCPNILLQMLGIFLFKRAAKH